MLELELLQITDILTITSLIYISETKQTTHSMIFMIFAIQNSQKLSVG